MGKVVKGFIAPAIHAERPPLEIPAWQDPTQDDLSRLLREGATASLTPRCLGMLRLLAGMPAAARLAYNLRGTGSLLAARDAPDYEYGLSDNELEAMYELELSVVTPEARRTAWALLSIHTRRQFVLAFGKEFERLRAGRNKKRLLDDSGDNQE